MLFVDRVSYLQSLYQKGIAIPEKALLEALRDTFRAGAASHKFPVPPGTDASGRTVYYRRVVMKLSPDALVGVYPLQAFISILIIVKFIRNLQA